ncbi:hypothetical protein [Bdellovibrio bacteriovorus]|uniref:hypothetical protein n=1 Tax=Bdellovibrio bacteriovorus TaxID=959 RepID=UPI0020A52AEA|nr:hypothetical protein [Bdellovibrio bacteriovorus]
MRKLILMVCLLASQSSLAFTDSLTLQTADNLIAHLQRQDNVVARLQYLETYKQFLFDRLNTIEIPDLATTPDDHPALEEYRSLTEYDNYVNLIRMKDINASTCQRTRTRIENSTSRDGGLVPEAVEAMKILNALCSPTTN